MNKKILLIGSSGYLGKHFVAYMDHLKIPYTNCISFRYDINKSFLYNQERIEDILDNYEFDNIINCAGYVGVPNVDACEKEFVACLAANTFIPKILENYCKWNQKIYGHISTGCIFQGDKMFSFEQPNFTESVYSLTKAHAESILSSDVSRIFRFRLPFGPQSNNKNYLSKLCKFDFLNPFKNSISNIVEVVHSVLEILNSEQEEIFLLKEQLQGDIKREYVIYNLVNTEPLHAMNIVPLLQDFGLVDKNKQWEIMTEEKIKEVEKVKRSNCTLKCYTDLNFKSSMWSTEKSIVSCLKFWDQPIEKYIDFLIQEKNNDRKNLDEPCPYY